MTDREKLKLAVKHLKDIEQITDEGGLQNIEASMASDALKAIGPLDACSTFQDPCSYDKGYAAGFEDGKEASGSLAASQAVKPEGSPREFWATQLAGSEEGNYFMSTERELVEKMSYGEVTFKVREVLK